MLKKPNRLSSNFEFNVVKKYGYHIEGVYSHIYWLKPKNYTGEPKIGIVISNKFDKRAVVRNRVKRVFREIVQKNLENISKDHWIVIYPKFSSLNKSYEEISSDFSKILQKISFTG